MIIDIEEKAELRPVHGMPVATHPALTVASGFLSFLSEADLAFMPSMNFLALEI